MPTPTRSSRARQRPLPVNSATRGMMMRLSLALAVCLLGAVPGALRAQDEAGRDPTDTVKAAETKFPNNIAGEFTPAKGFDLAKTKMASLNISFYGLFRYMNQLPGDQTFVDHLGRVRQVKTRNDLNWHRTFVWLTGFFYVPKFRYNISLWSLPTTQQTLLFGNLQYRFNTAATLGVGIVAVLGIERPADVGRFFPRGILVGRIPDRTADTALVLQPLRQHEHQPAR